MERLQSRRSFMAALLCGLVAASTSAQSGSDRNPTLRVGDMAPPVKGDWVKGSPIAPGNGKPSLVFLCNTGPWNTLSDTLEPVVALSNKFGDKVDIAVVYFRGPTTIDYSKADVLKLIKSKASRATFSVSIDGSDQFMLKNWVTASERTGDTYFLLNKQATIASITPHANYIESDISKLLAEGSDNFIKHRVFIQPGSNTSTPEPKKNYRGLSELSLGFTGAQITGVDKGRLKDGFVILTNSAGEALYELPLRLSQATRSDRFGLGSEIPKPEILDCFLSATHVYVVLKSESLFILSAPRPSGLVDARLTAADLAGREIDRLLQEFPNTLFPEVILSNIKQRMSTIEKRRSSGDYLSPADAKKDEDELNGYFLDSVNEAFGGASEELDFRYGFGSTFQFERPLVQVRNLRRLIEKEKAGSKSHVEAARILNYYRMLSHLRGSTLQNPAIFKGTDGRDTYTFNTILVPPYPFGESEAFKLLVINASNRPVWYETFKGEVQSDGSLRFKCDATDWSVFKP